jgi:hypothetical protein
LRRAAVVSLLVKRWGEPKQCLRWRGRAAPLEPRRKRRGSDQPLRRAAVVSLLVKRWDEPKQCPRWRGRAAPLEPRRKRRGSDQPLRRAGVVSLLVKRWGERKQCPRWRCRAAPLEPRRKRRGSDQPLRRAAVVSLLWTRWGRVCAISLEPRCERLGSGELIQPLIEKKAQKKGITATEELTGFAHALHRWSPGASAGGATNQSSHRTEVIAVR